MPSKSKTKGNAFERDVRDILNKAYNTEEFARTPNSGAIMGKTNYARNQGLSEQVQTTLGSDLICPEWFPFSVECKSYATKPNYSTIVKGADTDLDGWLGETCYDAKNLGLHPLLFFKTNRKGTHVAVPIFFQTELHLQYYLMYDDFIVMGIDTFLMNANQIKRSAEYLKPITTDWLRTSKRVERLIEIAHGKKRKK